MKKINYYKRLNLAERISIENGLDKNKSARQISLELKRSTTTITREILSNRTYATAKRKGELFKTMNKDYCPRLQSFPYVCNGCNKRHNFCKQKYKAEYCAQRSNTLAAERMKESRKGINIDKQNFEYIIYQIKDDLKRGLSPYQISVGRKNFPVSTNTIYRWISRGYAGLSNFDLRRKVKYKPRNKHVEKRPTSHGTNRSYAAFCKLSHDTREAACEMDTVIGLKYDNKCILTLYLRSCKFQFAILLKDKSCKSVCKAIDSIESILGKDYFKSTFETILTDNGTEFYQHKDIEKSVFGGKRTSVYYCDIRASQQKGACEKNHVELRKMIPKGKGISFDQLTFWDMSTIMSHINSQPRKSLCGQSPISVFKNVYGGKGLELLQCLGVEEVPLPDLNLNISTLNDERIEKGMVKIY